MISSVGPVCICSLSIELPDLDSNFCNLFSSDDVSNLQNILFYFYVPNSRPIQVCGHCTDISFQSWYAFEVLFNWELVPLLELHMLIKNVYAIYTRFPIVDSFGHSATDFQSYYDFEVLFGGESFDLLFQVSHVHIYTFLIKEL